MTSKTYVVIIIDEVRKLMSRYHKLMSPQKIKGRSGKNVATKLQQRMKTSEGVDMSQHLKTLAQQT